MAILKYFGFSEYFYINILNIYNIKRIEKRLNKQA